MNSNLTQHATVIDTRVTKVGMHDASRPHAVCYGGRVIGRYTTKTAAQRRAREV